MGAPLYDITIYYHGLKIKDAPEDWDFRQKANYITDFYHHFLLGYKPPKTGRICIHLSADAPEFAIPYFGSICSVAGKIDEQYYLSLESSEQLKYLLDATHIACMYLCDKFNWDRSKFEYAYDTIVKNLFVFTYAYPPKKSRNRRFTAQVIIKKTTELSTLLVAFTSNEGTQLVEFFTKENDYWYDPVYDCAKTAKWINNECFLVYYNQPLYLRLVLQDISAQYNLITNEMAGSMSFPNRAEMYKLARQ